MTVHRNRVVSATVCLLFALGAWILWPGSEGSLSGEGHPRPGSRDESAHATSDTGRAGTGGPEMQVDSIMSDGAASARTSDSEGERPATEQAAYPGDASTPYPMAIQDLIPEGRALSQVDLLVKAAKYGCKKPSVLLRWIGAPEAIQAGREAVEAGTGFDKAHLEDRVSSFESLCSELEYFYEEYQSDWFRSGRFAYVKRGAGGLQPREVIDSAFRTDLIVGLGGYVADLGFRSGDYPHLDALIRLAKAEAEELQAMALD